MSQHTCETCRLWKKGDPSVKKIGNAGVCTALMPQTSGFYDRSKTAPFWAEQLTFVTNSYEGKECSAFVSKRKRKPQP